MKKITLIILIANLFSQTNLQTKLFETNIIINKDEKLVNDLFNIDIDNGSINIVDVESDNLNGDTFIRLDIKSTINKINYKSEGPSFRLFDYGYFYFAYYGSISFTFSKCDELYFYSDDTINVKISFAITAQFPIIDNSPPNVTITKPINFQKLNETTSIKVKAVDDYGIKKVDFYIDGTLVFSDKKLPYEYEWDVCSFENGDHTILVEATDKNGNQSLSNLLKVNTNGIYDCNKTCGGTLILDECGECGGSGIDSDNDNICDDIDDCIGKLDDCNVCNGPGYDCGGSCYEHIQLWEDCYNINETKSVSKFSSDLKGQIPADIGKLTNLNSIELGFNLLKGEIPKEIANLKKLKYLGLYSNNLSGDIPNEVCNLIEENNINIKRILQGNKIKIRVINLYFLFFPIPAGHSDAENFVL